jgi:hypothetical protein
MSLTQTAVFSTGLVVFEDCRWAHAIDRREVNAGFSFETAYEFPAGIG